MITETILDSIQVWGGNSLYIADDNTPSGVLFPTLVINIPKFNDDFHLL